MQTEARSNYKKYRIVKIFPKKIMLDVQKFEIFHIFQKLYSHFYWAVKNNEISMWTKNINIYHFFLLQCFKQSDTCFRLLVCFYDLPHF